MFDVKGLRFAPIICYDIRIPELSRVLTINHNVDCILHCGAYFRDESFATWHPFVITRAMENQIFFLSLNRAGRDYGHSLFCPPWVDERHLPSVFEDRSEEFKYLEIDKTKIENARTQYTFLRDRLIDYSALSRRQN